jgi:hypothetical protein
MKEIKATANSVLGFFINPPGMSKSLGGVIMLDDDGKEQGIKTRYFEVHDVGERTQVYGDINPGDIVAVSHGRWSRGIDIDREDGKKIHSIDPKDILGIYDGPVENIV